MTQDTYRFALEEASAELREIQGQFEQLRARKESVEQVVEALRPLLLDQPTEAITDQQLAETAPFLVQPNSDVLAEGLPQAAPDSLPEPAYAGEQSSDPFQRRIDNALKHGLGSRESRVLPRALNGLLSRA
jgi:hypothetical protein